MVPLTDMQPGDIFLTAYGVAVVVKKCENQILKTLIWREAGKSIGSASTAYLRHDSVSLRRGDFDFNFHALIFLLYHLILINVVCETTASCTRNDNYKS